ncbi:MAG: class I SAM-dependent methyltransferase [Parcubacteria group bacterium]
MIDNKFILDACCGGRMMWFNKHHPNAIYIDNRVAEKGHIQKGINPNHQVKPDMVMDFRKIDFPDKNFKLVVFDPPHLTTLAESSVLGKKFGCLNAETWQSDLKKGFEECWRVLEDYGVLLFKWSDIEIPYKKVLSFIKVKPLFMNITAGQKALKDKHRSFWFCFMKIPLTVNKKEDAGIPPTNKLVGILPDDL